MNGPRRTSPCRMQSRSSGPCRASSGTSTRSSRRSRKMPAMISSFRRTGDFRRTVRQADLEVPAELLTVLEPFLNAKPPEVVQKNWPGGKTQALAEQDAWTRFADNYAKAYVQTLRRALRRRHESRSPRGRDLRSPRRDSGLLNFQDLLLAAARLLRENPVIRTYFRKRFTHLLIDEFQDTDPIQAEVMMLLVADDPTVTDWRSCSPGERLPVRCRRPQAINLPVQAR